MNKATWIVVVLAIGGYFGYFVNSYIEDNAKRAEAKKNEQATKLAVAQLVLRTGAVDDWESALDKNETLRMEPILTVELEKLWLQNRPILFIGVIKDIATQDQLKYTVSVKRSPLYSFDHMFTTGLELSLRSTKKRMDSFLTEHPNLFKEFEFSSGVAVVARIEAIRTIDVSGREGGREAAKIGDGELLEIVYTGGAQF